MSGTGPNMRGAPKWIFDHDEALKRLIAANYSFSEAAAQINAEFGTVYSRNAAIGRAHRLGLSSPLPKDVVVKCKKARYVRNAINTRDRRLKAREFGPVSDKPAILAPRGEVFAPPFLGRLDIPLADLVVLSETEANQCRYVEPSDCGPVYLTCANATEPGRSYCGHHHIITHQQDKRRHFHVQGVRRGMKASNFSGSFEPA